MVWKPQIKHTHTHKRPVQYANSHTHNLWYTEAFFLPASLTHTYTHTNLHSLIWVDSGNRSSELAGGPRRGRRGGTGEKRGDQSEDESSSLAEKKQQKREEKRKKKVLREKKRERKIFFALEF